MEERKAGGETGRNARAGWLSAYAGAAMLAVIVLLSACGAADGAMRTRAADGEQVVHVFSARHYEGDQLLFERFAEKTGIQVREVKGTAVELVERLRAEGGEANADLFIAADGGVMEYAKRRGVLQQMRDELVERQVPADWRDPDRYWVAIAARARVIAYAKDRVAPGELSSYEDLTDERWKGRVLARSSSNLYNRSMLASFIALNGEQQAARWASGIAGNLARPPEGGDIAQVKAVAAGVGDAAIVNAYYIGQMLQSQDPEEARAAERLGIVFPNQHSIGTHVNVSGAGLTRYARNRENALKLLEFVTSREGQTLLVQESFEFPVNAEADMPALLESWGPFKAQPVDFAAMLDYSDKAAELFISAGWD